MKAPRRKLEIALQRLRNQRLVGPPFASALEGVRWLGAVQAQDFAGAKWALAQRTAGSSDAEIDALFERGAILRTHVLRPTWHFVLPSDIHWLLGVSAGRVKQAMAPYDRKLALDGATFARSQTVMAAALEGGRHLTRTQLRSALAAAGIHADGQRLGHLMMRAELDAVLCSGPRLGKQFTYALLDERAHGVKPTQLPRDEALAQLALRYFTGHGPAQVNDFAWWSGSSVTDAKRALASVQGQLASVALEGKLYWFDPEQPKPERARSELRLLPNYDELLVAYKDHAPSFDASRHLQRGPLERFLGQHVLTRNGYVIGGWRRTLQKARVTLETRTFVALGREDERALKQAADRFGRFLGIPGVEVVRV